MSPRAKATAPSSPLVWLTRLSLDAPVVAVLWQRLFARSMKTPLSAAATAVLAMAVWLLYVFDRILDSFSATPSEGEAPRHQFYRRHRLGFLWSVPVVLIGASWLALTQLNRKTLLGGLLLILAIGVYFYAVHLRQPKSERKLPKELMVALIFAVGTCFPIWEQLQGGWPRMLAGWLIFGFLCWVNCAVIEFSEWRTARPAELRDAPGASLGSSETWPDAPHATTQWLGRHSVAATLVTAAASAMLALLPSSRSMGRLYGAEALAAVALMMVGSSAERMPKDLFRVMMDIALWSPALFLLNGR